MRAFGCGVREESETPLRWHRSMGPIHALEWARKTGGSPQGNVANADGSTLLTLTRDLMNQGHKRLQTRQSGAATGDRGKRLSDEPILHRAAATGRRAP